MKRAFYRCPCQAALTLHPEPALESILRDELGRFLSGRQSGESAAQAIQRRVQLCLDERK